LGIDISLTWVGLLLFGIPAALACLWSWRDLRSRRRAPVPPWERRNTRWLAGLLLLLPLQLALLRLGPAHGTLDQIGVLLTIAQWLLLGRALRPYPAFER